MVKKGWFNESKRHGLARRGIKSAQKIPQIRFIKKPPMDSENKLPVQVGFIVPSTKEHDVKISKKEFDKRVEEQKKYMSKLFKGDTSVKTIGSYWDGESKKWIKEDGVLVQSSMSVEKYNKEIKELTEYIEDMRKKYGQDTILVKVEGQDFITPKKSYIGHDKAQDNFILVS